MKTAPLGCKCADLGTITTQSSFQKVNQAVCMMAHLTSTHMKTCLRTSNLAGISLD